MINEDVKEKVNEIMVDMGHLPSLFTPSNQHGFDPQWTTLSPTEPVLAGGARFTRDIGVDYSKQTLASATDFIWRTFQQSNAAGRKNIQTVNLFIDVMGGDVRREITGVLYHEMAHIWQWNGNGQTPGGLIEGIADFVRLKANYAPSHWVQAGQGDRWDQGYDVTAKFLDYCNGLRNGFVAELNKKMKTGYSAQYFVDLLGKTVDQLWKDYKAKYGQ
ncbi:hypothetical protein POTOM_002321 [Populus tomentosa]|uniref:Plant basic secretory protein (BSP) family protein n=1 Tax=Populus tomentosa TaxID=118781 RepID=A0A8X8DJK7_POPTO|nr:hypothetical protein POTOM_002321 [Populus tomentosa]